MMKNNDPVEKIKDLQSCLSMEETNLEVSNSDIQSVFDSLKRIIALWKETESPHCSLKLLELLESNIQALKYKLSSSVDIHHQIYQLHKDINWESAALSKEQRRQLDL